jgi:hypothetical protein
VCTDNRTSRPARDQREQDALNAIDARITALARSVGAREMHYPALISRACLEHAGYPEAFPHLLLTAAAVAQASPSTGDARPAALERTEWCLSPAVCYHVYAQLAGARLRKPFVATSRGSCFRHEQETSPGVRQIEFEMREVVFLGPARWIEDAAAEAAARLTSVALRVGLRGTWTPAEDPFFLPAAAGKAIMQKLLGLKQEYRLDGPDGLALASVNRHGTFFGERFDIHDTESDAPVHTACLAIGLDRWHAHGTRSAREEMSHVEESVAPV